MFTIDLNLDEVCLFFKSGRLPGEALRDNSFLTGDKLFCVVEMKHFLPVATSFTAVDYLQLVKTTADMLG